MPRTSTQKKLLRLIKKQDGVCVWCNQVIVPSFNGKYHEVVEVLPFYVRFRKVCDGTLHFARMATIEHLVPKCLGGTNGSINLAAACAECNNKRGRRPGKKRRVTRKIATPQVTEV